MPDVHKDAGGQSYSGNGQGPAGHGAPVKIWTPNGPVAGSMSGGFAVPNK
jgi:hypothetical protein